MQYLNKRSSSILFDQTFGTPCPKAVIWALPFVAADTIDTTLYT